MCHEASDVARCAARDQFGRSVTRRASQRTSSFGIFAGLISNFSGGITNTATITAAAGVVAGFPGFGITTFSGRIINRGTITARSSRINVFDGAPMPHDSALASAGAQMFFTPNWSLLVKFDGEFASASQTYAGSGTLRYTC